MARHEITATGSNSRLNDLINLSTFTTSGSFRTYTLTQQMLLIILILLKSYLIIIWLN